MVKLVNVLLIFTSIFFYSPFVSAKTSPKNDNILVMANKVVFNNKTKQSTLSGDVIVQQGKNIIHADKAITFGDKNNHLIKTVALGNDKLQARFTASITNDANFFKGLADKLVYYPLRNEVLLEGNAVIEKGKNTYKAPIIRYNLKLKRIVSIQKNKQRTKIVIKEKVAWKI